MNVLYLKSITENALTEALSFARGIDLEDSPFWREATHEYSLDIIGNLYNDDAVWDGVNLITPATKIPGFHANIICNDRILALIPTDIIIIPPPNRIQRMWA